jgi:hypothetical protein
VTSTNKTDRYVHDITEILLKVALDIIKPHQAKRSRFGEYKTLISWEFSKLQYNYYKKTTTKATGNMSASPE